MNEIKREGPESFRAWVPGFDYWPRRWMGVQADLVYGRKLLPHFAGFLQALVAGGMARKTFTRYRDQLWLLGGTIIREVSRFEAYRDDPLGKLAESVSNGGLPPDHHDQMTQAELRAFERMCRKFETYLEESK